MKTGCSYRNLGNNILKDDFCASLTVLKKQQLKRVGSIVWVLNHLYQIQVILEMKWEEAAGLALSHCMLRND